MSTAGTILTYAWNVLNEDGTTVSNPAMQQATMLAVLNSVNAEWKRTFRRGAGEPPKVLAKETAFDLKSSTTLSADQATSDTTTSLTSGTDFDTSGAYVIYDDGMPDIQENTGKSSNTLSGVTGNDWAHESGDTVIKLYALPSNFHSFRASPNNPEGVEVGNTPYLYVPDDPQSGQFSLYDNGTTKYLWMPIGVSGSCRVFYNKNSTTIDETTDSVDVPVEYEWFLVHRLVEHGRRSRGDNPDKVMESKNQGDMILREAQAEKNTSKIARTRPIGRPRGLDDYYQLTTRDD